MRTTKQKKRLRDRRRGVEGEANNGITNEARRKKTFYKQSWVHAATQVKVVEPKKKSPPTKKKEENPSNFYGQYW